jgi:outer membrane lipoprotein LolB
MILRKWHRGALIAALPALLVACASIAPSPGNLPQAQQKRLFHETIELAGRLSVRYESARKEEAVHGSFAWTQTPARTVVTLLSPLGQTMAVIEATPDGATLTQAGQPPRSAGDVDTLTAHTLGWPLPVSGLRGWLQGFAIDASGHTFVASPENNEVVTSDGWRIRYANWREDASPGRIDLTRHTEQAGQVSLRIVIDSWQTS